MSSPISARLARRDVVASESISDVTPVDLLHELRQPLTSIKMNLQAAVRLLGDPEPRVTAALEAITDCLKAEHDVVALLASTFERKGVPLALEPRGVPRQEADRAH